MKYEEKERTLEASENLSRKILWGAAPLKVKVRDSVCLSEPQFSDYKAFYPPGQDGS